MRSADYILFLDIQYKNRALPQLCPASFLMKYDPIVISDVGKSVLDWSAFYSGRAKIRIDKGDP